MTENQNRLSFAMIVINFISIIFLFSISITTFVYGNGQFTLLYLILYPLFLVSTILIIAKLQIGIILSLLISIIYCCLLTPEIGRYFVFEKGGTAYFWGIVFPYFLLLIIIALAISYFAEKSKFKNKIRLASILFSSSFLFFSIIERFDKNYSDNIFIDAEIDKNVNIKLICRPSFGDSDNFILTNNSSKLSNQIKNYGKYYQGSYFLSNTILVKNYRFKKLKSITITEINHRKIYPKITWKAEDIKGNIDFLEPTE